MTCWLGFKSALSMGSSSVLTRATAAFTSSPAFSTLASGGVNIDIDRTVLLMAGLFTLLVFILGPLLFAPLLRLFEERERRTEGARAEARAMQEKSAELLSRYQAELERVQKVAAHERDRLRSEALRLETKILDDAQQATHRIVQEGRAHIAIELTRVRSDLAARTQAMAQEFAGSVLGRGSR